MKPFSKYNTNSEYRSATICNYSLRDAHENFPPEDESLDQFFNLDQQLNCIVGAPFKEQTSDPAALRGTIPTYEPLKYSLLDHAYHKTLQSDYDAKDESEVEDEDDDDDDNFDFDLEDPLREDSQLSSDDPSCDYRFVFVKSEPNATIELDDSPTDRLISSTTAATAAATVTSRYQSQNNKLACLSCNEVFENKSSLLLHRMTQESCARKFKCRLCDTIYDKRDDLIAHNDAFHQNVKTFSCKDCGRTFAKKFGLYLHVKRVHEKLKPYSCDRCDKSFFGKSELNTHVFSCHNYRRGVILRSAPAALKKDSKINTCDICQKSFTRRSGLVHHIQVMHARLKPFVCALCDKTFSRRYYLNDHVKVVHQGEKNFGCEICGKRFAHKNSLAKHALATHRRGAHAAADDEEVEAVDAVDESSREILKSEATDKNFVCTICNVGFVHKNNLHLHMVNVHRLQVYSYKTHKKIVHVDTQSA